MLRRRASIVILAFALAACARATNDAEAPGSVSAATGPATTGPADIGLEDVEGVAPDPAIWDRPLGPIGVQISSSDSPALDDLAYKPVLPSDDLGSPTAVYVSDVGVVGKAAQQIAWVYDDATAGRYIVIESPSGASQADLEEPAHLAPGCRTTASEIEGADTHIECVPDDFSLVKIDDSTVALAVQNDYVTSVSWLRSMEVRDSQTFDEFASPTIEIKVMAPAGKATLDDLISVANRF